ncbi:hypothetical protein JHK82_056404 [Glycine max]|nr:hypothetical protein JHK85_057245 [Glycine max]KAG5075048.1 hypothetical protein JHK84_056279 [Glycine max]KAG5077709.1 hypothetical protein JHK82_056404 [Glycine max]
MFIAGFIFIAGVAFCAAAQNLAMLIFGGASFPFRDRTIKNTLSMFQLNITLGIPLANLVNYATNNSPAPAKRANADDTTAIITATTSTETNYSDNNHDNTATNLPFKLTTTTHATTTPATTMTTTKSPPQRLPSKPTVATPP